MRTSNGKGSGVPKAVMESADTQGKQEVVKEESTLDLEETQESTSEEPLEETDEVELETASEEDVEREPQTFDDIGWDGGQSLPDCFQEVNNILDEYQALQIEREIQQRVNEQLWDTQREEKLNQDEESEDTEEQPETEEVDLFEDEPEEGMSRKKKITIASIIAAVILAIGVGAFFLFNSATTTAADLQIKVNRLYTSQAKTDIKNSVDQDSLQNYYAALDALESKEKKTDTAVNIEHELDTVGYFISDKALLMEFDSDSYDLSSASLMESIEKIKSNTANYTVPGLALTANDLCTKIETDFNNYVSLRDELNAITDVTTFVPDTYKARVDAIKHTVNKNEVKTRFDQLSADKATAEAKSELEKQAAEKLQKEAEEAKKKAEEENNKLKQELQDAQDKLKDKGSSIKDEVQNFLGVDDSEGEQSEGEYEEYNEE